jgi:hypothetical protein
MKTRQDRNATGSTVRAGAAVAAQQRQARRGKGSSAQAYKAAAGRQARREGG